MGMLVDGRWHEGWYDTRKHGGRFVREDSLFRNWVTPDGAPGSTGEGGFAAEPGRYRLYVSLACPWASRAMAFRALKGLEDMLPVSVVNPCMGPRGWSFRPAPGVVADPVAGAEYLSEIYVRARRDYTGRVTVPVLWDMRRDTIVSNESADIIRMMNAAFDHLGATPGDYYPAALREEIDAINARVYRDVNNGVYKAGFATEQAAYEEAVTNLFAALDALEARLRHRRYLTGARITEADWRLFTTLVRFDPVYAYHFKCNIRRLTDYPALWGYTRELFQVPGIAATVDFDHIKLHYYTSHPTVNPNGIVPKGPVLDFGAPHGRDHLPAAAG